MSRRIALGTTGTTPDPPPVELADGEALIANLGPVRVVLRSDGTLTVIEDGEGTVVFDWTG